MAHEDCRDCTLTSHFGNMLRRTIAIMEIENNSAAEYNFGFADCHGRNGGKSTFSYHTVLGFTKQTLGKFCRSKLKLGFDTRRTLVFTQEMLLFGFQ